MAKQRKSSKQKGGAMRLKKRPDPMLMQGDGVWDTIKNVAGKVNKFLKDTKVLSTVAGLVPPSTPYIGAIAQPASIALKSLGYGKPQLMGVPNMVDGANYNPVGQTSVMSGKGRKKVIGV